MHSSKFNQGLRGTYQLIRPRKPHPAAMAAVFFSRRALMSTTLRSVFTTARTVSIPRPATDDDRLTRHTTADGDILSFVGFVGHDDNEDILLHKMSIWHILGLGPWSLGVFEQPYQ